jgi:hypothetical protein
LVRKRVKRGGFTPVFWVDFQISLCKKVEKTQSTIVSKARFEAMTRVRPPDLLLCFLPHSGILESYDVVGIPLLGIQSATAAFLHAAESVQLGIRYSAEGRIGRFDC